MTLLPLPAQARVLALIVLASSAAPPLGAQLPYQDGLDSAATAKIKPLVAPDMEGSFVDYSNFTVGAVTHAIPEAPGRVSNSAPTRGYLIRNLYSGDSRITNVLLADAPDGNPVVFSGNYRLKFDMYLSLDPSATRASIGTTEVGLWGVGNDGFSAVGYFHRSTIANGVWGWLTVDGGIVGNGDATIYDGITNLGRKQDTVDTTLFMSAFPTGAPITGDANNQWTQVEITVFDGMVTARYNGITFFEAPAVATSGFVLFGYEDAFPTSDSFSAAYQWGLFDNVVVEEAQSPTMNVTQTRNFVTVTSDAPSIGEFTVENRLATDLTITAVNFTGANAADFVLTTQLPVVVPPGASRALEVSFDPAAPNGVKGASMEIVSNNPQTPTFTFSPLQARRSIAPAFQAHYRMNESSGTILGDASPEGTNGVLQVRDPLLFSQPPLAADGGTSMCFTPANTSLTGNYATSPIIHFPTVTLSAWIKPEASGPVRTIFNRDPDFAAGDKIFGLHVTDTGSLRLRIRSTAIIETGDGAILDGQTYHVAVTHLDNDGFGNETAARTRLYINGAMVGEKLEAETTGFDDYPFGAPSPGLHIGSRTAAGAGFSGCIDDVQLYAIELPDWQIAALFANPGQSLSELPEYRLEISRITFTPQTRTVVLEWPSHANRFYKVGFSRDLATWTELAANHPSQGAVTTFTEAGIAPAETARYYQVSTDNP